MSQFLAFNAFQIKPNGNVKVFLKDNVGIAIPKEKLLDHVKAFWRNGAFFIDVSYEGDSNSQTVDIVTPVMFEDYLKEVNELQLLVECKGKNEKDVLSRQKIVQAAVNFMISIFGEDVSMFHRQATANALINLFPFIGYQNGQQIGIVCNTIFLKNVFQFDMCTMYMHFEFKWLTFFD